MPSLTFDDVSITYHSSRGSSRRDVQAVRNVSLELSEGGTLGIAGESGSGKSTLAMSVLRLLPASADVTGRVLIDGQDVHDLSFGRLRAVRWSQAAVVFQGAMHSLNPVQRVSRQIEEALELHVKDEWATRESRERRVRDLLDMVGLPPAKGTSYPHQLSGGQKQRIMIAMALACDPDIIIADEPTTALDVIIQAQVLGILRRLIAERGISLLMISHDLSVLQTACERIAVMREGRIIEVGQADQIRYHGQEPYTRLLAAAFPTIGDPASRMRPATQHHESEPEADTTATPVPADHDAVLRAFDVSVTFPSSDGPVSAVRHVTLDCHAGEIVVLAGQSGSGKTTLARTLLGLQAPDPGGEVSWRGRRLEQRPRALKRFRREVQLVLQDPSAALNPKQTVYEAVAEGLRIHGIAGDEPTLVREALEAAELSPAEEYFQALPSEISGGQQQRVVIAGALVLGPMNPSHPWMPRSAARSSPCCSSSSASSGSERSSSPTTSASPGTSPTACSSCTRARSSKPAPPRTCCCGRRTPTRASCSPPCPARPGQHRSHRMPNASRMSMSSGERSHR